MPEPRKITPADVDRILDEHPKLGLYGYNHPDTRDSDKLDVARRSLRERLDEVQEAYDWLLTLYPAPEGARWPTSYGLKHDGERTDALAYVTNGAMIVAALLAEVPVRIGDGPNPQIGVSLTAPRPAPPEGSFTEWLLRYTDEPHPIGDLARDVERDDDWPADGASVDDAWPAETGSYAVYRNYLLRVHAHEGALRALREAWTAYAGTPPEDDDED